MKTLVTSITFAAVMIVALLHVAFMVLEMFFWTDPIGYRVFSTTPETAANSAVLAANQGLYNGFLAAGIVWSYFTKKPQTLLFFLGCVIVTGIFGALTSSLTILFVQALPGTLAFALVVLAGQAPSHQEH